MVTIETKSLSVSERVCYIVQTLVKTVVSRLERNLQLVSYTNVVAIGLCPTIKYQGYSGGALRYDGRGGIMLHQIARDRNGCWSTSRIESLV